MKMNNKITDGKVGIVGAGIVGLYLAWKLSRIGYRVTVFERREKIWDKPCSGLISENIKKFIPAWHDLIDNKVDVSLIHFPKKDIKLIFKPIHYVFSHQKINLYLLEMARGAGARILFGKNIEAIPSGFDRIIACDGAVSKIRKILSLPDPSFRLGIQTVIHVEDFSNQVETWPIENGFLWKIPRGRSVEYGGIGPIDSVKIRFADFLKKHNIQSSGLDKLALVPQGIVLPRNNKSVTLCGDSAGLTKPWSGGGIIWGLTAADTLIDSFPDFGLYNRKIRRMFGFRILKGRMITSLVGFLGSNLPFLLPGSVARNNDFPFI